MKLALFAADAPGLEIVRHFKKENVTPSCLCLDSNDEDFNEAILAVGLDCTVIYSDALYSEDTQEKLKGMQIDLGILAWWPYIVKSPLLGIAKTGFLNMHPSLLPHNRGKYYYFWTLAEQSPAGVSLHFIDEEIDSGDIVYQQSIETDWTDTGRSLRDRSVVCNIELFKKHFRDIASGNLPRKPQDFSCGSYHHGHELEPASQIHLDKPYTGREMLNLLRARSGFEKGGPWFEEAGKKYRATIKIEEDE